MKKFFGYSKDFIRTDYSLSTYLAVTLFLLVSISVNYYFDVENEIIEKQKNQAVRFLFYIILYSTAYYGTIIIYYYTSKINYFLNKELMIKSFVALLLISFDGAFRISTDFLQFNFLMNKAEAIYIKKLSLEVFPILVYFIGILFLHYKYDPLSKSLYGLSLRNFHWKPYFILFLFMIPLVGWASFQEDFTVQYPFYKYWNYEAVFGLSQKQLFYIYEFFYIFNFINVELLFRGLLVIGMMNCMGQKAILPMIVTYAFLHFGKPPVETLSSALGGYILGIIAYRTETIFGGYLIHMGIALLMDIFALFQVNRES